jgi:hypothetical protein
MDRVAAKKLTLCTKDRGLFQGQLFMHKVQAKVLAPDTQKLKHLS